MDQLVAQQERPVDWPTRVDEVLDEKTGIITLTYHCFRGGIYRAMQCTVQPGVGNLEMAKPMLEKHWYANLAKVDLMAQIHASL